MCCRSHFKQKLEKAENVFQAEKVLKGDKVFMKRKGYDSSFIRINK